MLLFIIIIFIIVIIIIIIIIITIIIIRERSHITYQVRGRGVIENAYAWLWERGRGKWV